MGIIHSQKRFTLFAVIHLAAIFAFPICVTIFASEHSWAASPWASFAYYLIVVALPVLIYLWLTTSDPFQYLKMTGNIISGIGWGVLVGVLVCVVFFLINGLRFGTKGVTAQNIWLVTGMALIGLVEEIPFRGLYLQVFIEKMGFIWANVVSSLIFAALHAAVLFKGGGGALVQLMLLVIISLWLGYIFKKTQSFWAAAIVHSIYNLAVCFFS